MRLYSVVMLLLGLAAPLLAQVAEPDPNAKRLAWGTANVVLRSDTADGVYVYAATSKTYTRSIPSRSFAAPFDPDSVVNWAAYARKLLAAPKPPSTPRARLQTPPLRGIDQSSIILDRAADKAGWSARVSIVFTAPDTQMTWSIAAEVGQAAAFLAALERSASTSFYLPATGELYAPNPADTTICPRPLAQPDLHYPRARQAAGQQGDVWLTYVVRADSTVDPESIKVLVSDGADFTKAATHAVTSVRYRPAISPSGPRDAQVFQRISFLLR